MEAAILNDRYASLKHYANSALEKMKTDGLAKQLERHQASTRFVPPRLAEVLIEYLDSGREKFIQKITQDIEEASLKKDKITFKYKRTLKRAELESKEVREENQSLKQKKDDLVEHLQEMKARKRQMEEGYERISAQKEKQIRKNKELLKNTKMLLNDLRDELEEMKSKYTSDQDMCMRAFKRLQGRVKQGSIDIVYNNDKVNYDYLNQEVSKKEAELREMKQQNAEIRQALISIASTTNGIVASSGLRDKIDEKTIGNIQSVLSRVAEKSEDDAVKNHLEEAGINIPGVELTRDNFAADVKDLYERQLREQEKKYDRILREAKERRRALRAQVLQQTELLKSLQSSQLSDGNDLISDIAQDMESTAAALDKTMSKLGFRSTSTVSSNYGGSSV